MTNRKVEKLCNEICNNLQDGSDTEENKSLRLLRNMCGLRICACSSLTPSQSLSCLLKVQLQCESVLSFELGLTIINNYDSLGHEEHCTRILERIVTNTISLGHSEEKNKFLRELWNYPGLKNFTTTVVEDLVCHHTHFLEEDILDVFEKSVKKSAVLQDVKYERAIVWSYNSSKLSQKFFQVRAMSRLHVHNVTHSISSLTSRLSVPSLDVMRRSFERLSNILFKPTAPQLKRELSLVASVNLIVNGTIGSGIFVTPGIVLIHAGSVGMSLVIWAICGGISVLGALAFAELGMVIPKSGGQYAFFQAAFRDLHPFYGPITGFIYVWINVLVVYPATLAIFCYTFTEYIHEPLVSMFNAQLDSDTEDKVKFLIRFLALGIMGYINLASVKLYVSVQNMFSYLKLSICAMVILGALYIQLTGRAKDLPLGFDGTNYSTKALIMAFYSGLYTFDGWCIVTGVTEEIKDPDRNVLRSILIAVPMVTGLYLSMNLAYLTVLTIPQMVSEPAVAVAFGDLVFGKWKLIICLGVAFSAFGSGLCNVFAASRLCYVAAREGQLCESFSYIHMDKLTPVPAILVQIGLTGLFLLSGDMISLINFSNFLLWIFYGLAMITVFVLRKKKPDANRSYQVPLWIPALVMMIALLLAIIPIVTQPPMQYLVALAFIAIGVVVYYPFVYKQKSLPHMDKFTYFTQVLLEVVPTADPDAF